MEPKKAHPNSSTQRLEKCEPNPQTWEFWGTTRKLRMLKTEESTWHHERNCSSNEWLPSCYCCCWSTWGWVKRWARAQHRRPLQRSAAATGRTESSQTRSWWLHFSSHPWKMPPEILQILLQLQIEYETFWKQLSARDPLHHIRIQEDILKSKGWWVCPGCSRKLQNELHMLWSHVVRCMTMTQKV